MKNENIYLVMNSIKQHSDRWLLIKKYNLGANDIASLLSIGFNDPSEVIESKIHGTQIEHDETTQQLLDRGTRYENIVRKACVQRNGLNVVETGLKYHKKYKFITASPDGFCSKGEGFLLEFKVRSELSLKLPMKYWVQMQVQMEVWNINQCLYCENVVREYATREQYNDATQNIDPSMHGTMVETDHTYYWAIKEYREQYIERDQKWWSTVLPNIVSYWSLVEQGRLDLNTEPRRRGRKRTAEEAELTPATLEVNKRRAYLKEKEDMIQPWMLGNYIRDDPLLDWLNIYGPIEKRDTELNFFLSMIRNKNREFNSRMVSHIESMFPDSTYNICPCPFETIDVELEPHKLDVTFESIEKTRNAMAQKVPIIFNACFSATLPSYPYTFGGRADMIVLNKYLGDLLDLEEVPDEEDKYSVVAFKYATINLRADKTHLLNNGKQKVYKAHLWLLNSAIGVEQKCVMDRAYLLGRKYDFKKRGITYRVNNVFEGVGVVDFSEVDNNYEDTCRMALEWIQKVRSDEAKHWDPMCASKYDVPELYPNMKNSCDFPWHQYKQEIAHAIKEITLMYRCGPKIRDYAHEKGITEWTELTPDTIKYNAGKVLDQITTFVDVNTRTCTDTDIRMTNKPTPVFLEKRTCVEFYMDFEAIGNMYDDFSTFPIASSKAMIFLIGVVVVDNVKGTKNYMSYLVDTLDYESESIMVTRMLKDFKELREVYKQDFSPVYYWSNAENYMLKRAVGQHIVAKENLVMIDLCKCFRDGGFVMPGQMSYGLKEIAKLMKKNGMIETIWKENEDVSNGLNAMVEAVKTYQYRSAETRKQYFKDLIAYNYVDCKVMEEILEYLRTTTKTDNDISISDSDSDSDSDLIS